jgi:hypothetical protein
MEVSFSSSFQKSFRNRIKNNMVVFVNGKKVSIFRGATIQDVVRAYSLTSSKRLVSGYLAVYDCFGYRTEPDGPAVEGGQYFLRVADRSKR